MPYVSDDELLKRADDVGKAADVYRDYVFAKEIFKVKYDRILAMTKKEVRKTLVKEKVSETELERLALESQLWGEKIKVEIDLLKKAGQAKIDFEVAKTKYEAMRSALSSRREEIKKGL